MMRLIATHDSATGEKPTWWSALLTPFARTQSKTIKEQFDAGCRLFDLRVKKVFGIWRCAHGWWFTNKAFPEILAELWELSSLDDIYILVTYEGKTKNAKEFALHMECSINATKHEHKRVHFGPVCAKYGKDSKGLKVAYDVLFRPEDTFVSKPSKQSFLPLDGRTWHTYIPIPRLWKQFYFKNVTFNEEYYQFVDFL